MVNPSFSPTRNLSFSYSLPKIRISFSARISCLKKYGDWMPSVKSLPLPYTSIGSVRKSKRTVPIRYLSKPYGEAAIVSANIKSTRTNYQIEASYAEKNRDIQSYCTHNRRIPFFLQSNMTDISVYIPPFHNTSYFVCQFICFYLQIHFPS